MSIGRDELPLVRDSLRPLAICASHRGLVSPIVSDERELIPTADLLDVLWFHVPTNVLGGELRCCCRDPLTGFYRDGYCRTGSGDVGLHTVCAQMTNEFLEFSYSRGNDLVTPRPGFPGLKEGDRWCLCVTRWHEALEAGVAPPVDLHATHASTLEFVTLEELQAHTLT